MSRWCFIRVCLGLVWVACATQLVHAGPPATDSTASVAPPPVPSGKSPIAFFRSLLAMNDAERQSALANRSPEIRERLLAKVTEYQVMPPDMRDLRLRATELRWYLVPLLKATRVQRPALLAVVPNYLRQSVEDRLLRWDIFPPDLQQEFLENELALDYFTQAQTPASVQQKHLLAGLTQVQRMKLEADIPHWKAMSAGERQKIFERVSRFFDLTPDEQQKTLNTLSPTERDQMQETLEAFGKLPREQRNRCINAFEKFAGMNAAERQQFLQNAERWTAMSPEERQTWRDLVHKLPEMPPMPPGFYDAPLPPLPEPPMPTVTTNDR